jgi:M6 family metalloprotease-like protein
MFKTRLCVLVLASCLLLSTMAALYSPTLFVNAQSVVVPSTEYPTIQKAVDKVSAGSTITVSPGTYNENVVIPKSVTIQGSGPDSTTITGSYPFEIGASDVKISGFKIITTTDAGIGLQVGRACEITNNVIQGGYGANIAGDQTTVANNTFTGCLIGVSVTGAHTITDNMIINCKTGMWVGANTTITGNTVKQCPGDGIQLLGGNNLLRNNIVESCNEIGIDVSGSNNIIIENTVTKQLNNTNDNSIYGSGIFVWNSNNNNITGNTVSGNTKGIRVHGCSQTYLAFNKVENNTFTGIYVVGNLNYVLNNTISNNGENGIFIYDLENSFFYQSPLPPNYVSGNLVTGSKNGIYSLENNTVTWNDLITNKNSVGSSGGFWDYNLYSDYNGTDANKDGIGDTPYIIENAPGLEPIVVDLHPRTSRTRTEGRGINLLIVPVNLQDSEVALSSADYEDIGSKMTQYFKEVSYGTLDLKVTVHTNTDGSWVTVPNSTATYKSNKDAFFSDAVKQMDPDVEFTIYDLNADNGKGVVAFITANDIWGEGSFCRSLVGDQPVNQPLGGWLTTADGTSIDVLYVLESRFQGNNQIIRSLAHEFNHELGKIYAETLHKESTGQYTTKSGLWLTPDEYLMGNVVCSYSLMGNLSNLNIERVHPDSYIKEWLGWLKYSEVAVGTFFNVTQLDLMDYGGTIPICFPYSHAEGFIIFEVRSSASSQWDAEFSNAKSLEIYSVDYAMYAYAKCHENLVRTILTLGDNYTDPANGIVVTLIDFTPQGAQVKLKKFTDKDLVGAEISPSGTVLSSAADNTDLDQGFSVMPDVDLHAYADDGRHVGMNYQTGVYENQISGAIASGDLVDGTEWIFAPSGTTVHFVTCSNDTAAFLKAYPDMATVTNGTDSYQMSMVYYDSQGTRYDSSAIEQIIPPGATLGHNYTLTENSDGSYTVTVDPAAITNTSNQLGLPFDTTTIIIIVVVAISVIVPVALLAKRRSSNKAKNRGAVQSWPPPPPPPPP